MKSVMDNKHISHIIMFALIFISIFVSIILTFDASAPEYYTFLFLLPLSFAVLCIFFIRICNTSLWGIGSWMIIFLYFIRNVITPLFMKLGDYSGIFTIMSSESINKAIILMIYETLVVFIIINLSLNYKGHKSKKNNLNSKKVKTAKKVNLGYNIIFLLSIFCIISYIIIPEIRMNYNSIFNTSNVIADNYSIASANIGYGGLKRIVFTLTLFFIPLLQICLPIVFFIKIRIYFGERIIAIILSLLCIFPNFLMISGNNIDTFIITIVLSIILIRMHPKCEGLIIKILLVVMVIGITSMVVAKSSTSMFSETNQFATLSKTFQAYFQGVSNVAGVFNINNPSKMSTLFFDFFDMIPFRNTLFNSLNIKGDRLVIVFCRSNYVVSQIIPCIAQAYHYLGFIFAPIIPATLTYWAIKAQKRFRKEKNIFRYAFYLLIIIYLALATAMNNFTVFGTYFLNMILPIYFIAIFTGDNCLFDDMEEQNSNYIKEAEVIYDEYKK